MLGSGTWLVVQTGTVGAWLIVNLTASRGRWDPFPYYGLNLAFSVQAAYAAPLILLAHRRLDGRDRSQAHHDRTVRSSTQAHADFVTREVAAVRMELAAAASRADLDAAFDRLLDHLHQLEEAVQTAEAARRSPTA